MDLNGEAVDICRLSLWIKTAQARQGVDQPGPQHPRGQQRDRRPRGAPEGVRLAGRIPRGVRAGGFDAVISNPPYVRQEWIAEFKPYLQEHYRSYDGTADLYVYFYELGINLLRPGGRLSFIVTNKWMKAGYGEPLRRFFGESAWVESVVDFGHAKQIFEDADVFPSILVARKPMGTPRRRPPAFAPSRASSYGLTTCPGRSRPKGSRCRATGSALTPGALSRRASWRCWRRFARRACR